MEAPMASEMVAKPDQNELLQMHSMPPWKRYESEEEDVSETSSHVFSPTEGDITNDSDADESASEAEYVDAEMLAPTVYHRLSSDDSSSLHSHRLSIITAKRSSAATCVPTRHGQDASTDDNEDVSPFTEYMTPPVSPIYLSAVCYVPDGSESSSRDESSADAEDNDEDEVHEVSEAKRVFFTSPASKPSIIMIQSPTTEAILTARMGDPVQTQQSNEQNTQEGSTVNLRKISSTKRSSSASGMTTPVDRSKRYSAMFYRDFTQNGEVTYSDSRSHTRAQSSHSPARNSSRPRIGSRKDSLISNASNATDSSETRQSRPRRIPSQRSSSRSSRYAPDHESPRNFSRPRPIRSSSVASDMTAASSASWKRIHAHNWSSTSLQYPSSSSSVVDHPSSSSPSPPPGENESKPTPHPLSIITTPTSPTVASPDFQQSRFTPQQHEQQQPQSALTSHSNSSDIDWSPVEYRRSSTTPYQKTFPCSRPRNPSLSLTTALATASTESLTEDASSRSRRGSVATSTTTTTTTTTRARKSSISAVMSAAVGSSKSSNHSTSTMKLLMGGFRGLGKQRSSRQS
ncbi:hypothetical protein ZTR_02400 [Talaromyces verruculosus]|nr:hypothetical protein ZTR_02400 [Talaromyces verruculosus]